MARNLLSERGSRHSTYHRPQARSALSENLSRGSRRRSKSNRPGLGHLDSRFRGNDGWSNSAALKLPYSYLIMQAKPALGSGRGDREGDGRACRFIAETGGPGRAGPVLEGLVRQSGGTV